MTAPAAPPPPASTPQPSVPTGKRKRRWPFVVGGVVVVGIIIGIATSRGGNDTPSATTPVNQTPATQSADEGSLSPTTEAQKPAPRTATVGDTVEFKDASGSGTITLNGVRTITKPEGPIGGPAKNGVYLVADITIKATEGTVTPNPLAFKVSGPDGSTFDSELGVLDKQINSDEVPAGRQVRGEVAFDVPTGQPLLLDYAIFGPPLATFGIPAQ